MKISRHDKLLLFEMEFLSLLIIIILGYIFYLLMYEPLFYLIILLLGFGFYFWMLFEENLHKRGRKHNYFEHTSSYVMIAQTALVLGLLFLHLKVNFLIIIFLVISVIMYSVGLGRMLLYKAVFPD